MALKVFYTIVFRFHVSKAVINFTAFVYYVV
jgi:hypothetical protein